MDAHRAYCLNFLALTNRWGRGQLAIAAAWALSVLGITLTVAAAWLLGERLAIGPSPVDFRGLSRVEFWVAVVVTMVNYLRFFRFFLGVGAESRIAELLQHGRGRAPFAVVVVLGPAIIVLIIIAISPR
ncbi:MAG: hypothetical protein ACLP0B_31005 [Steroidobacteraceae bacterium]